MRAASTSGYRRSSADTGLDLDEYFARIAYTGEPKVDLVTLRALHRLHPFAIPFENLSTLTDEPVPLDIIDLHAKLVTRRRGGYCFEQNGLFKAVLSAIGFSITPLAARVVWNQDRGVVNPRTHMVLLVDLDDERWLADVGFGGATLTAPLELVTGIEQPTPHERFRLREKGGEFELEIFFEGRWRAMYQFDLQAQTPIDYDVLNHYVATHPSSHFRTRLLAGRPAEGLRYALGDNELTTYKEGVLRERRVLESGDEIGQTLRDVFGIALPSSAALDAALARIAERARS